MFEHSTYAPIMCILLILQFPSIMTMLRLVHCPNAQFGSILVMLRYRLTEHLQNALFCAFRECSETVHSEIAPTLSISLSTNFVRPC